MNCWFIDDLLIPGRDDLDHIAIIDRVLTKLEEAGMIINLKKCRFMTSRANFLGFVVTPLGVSIQSD